MSLVPQVAVLELMPQSLSLVLAAVLPISPLAQAMAQMNYFTTVSTCRSQREPFAFSCIFDEKIGVNISKPVANSGLVSLPSKMTTYTTT